MRGNRRRTALLAVLLVVAACTGDDDDDAAPTSVPDDETAAVRFCDAFLDYLSDPTPGALATVVESGDERAADLAPTITGADPEAAATADAGLREAARQRCQPEWTAGAQGAGSTAGAAEAFLAALVAGDRIGARNVASANAIALFDPWTPADDATTTPVLADVGERRFTIEVDASAVYECEVDVGVVLTCAAAP